MPNPESGPHQDRSAILTEREIEELRRSAPRAANTNPPVLGRIGLIALLAGWALWAYLGFFQQGLHLPFDGRVWTAILSLLLGLSFAIASLVKKERRSFAVATIVLVVAAPVLLGILVVVAWALYAAGAGYT